MAEIHKKPTGPMWCRVCKRIWQPDEVMRLDDVISGIQWYVCRDLFCFAYNGLTLEPVSDDAGQEYNDGSQ